MSFEGVHVVDALGGLLGGYCAKLLVDAGASATVVAPDGDGALFAHLRRGQERGDPGSAIDRADCLLIGLDGPDPEPLLAARPDLVIVSITPYGRSGPWRDRPATDFTLQADSGGLTIRGRPDRPPYHAGGRITDWLSAVIAATGAAAALQRAQRSGRGGLVDVSRAECATLTMTNYAALMADLRGPKSLRFPPAITETPAVEPTADGYAVFTTNTFQQLQSFCLMIGRPELAEQYASAASRQIEWDGWNELVHEWMTARTTADILEQASELRIPTAPVCNGATVTEVEHFVARGVYERDATHGHVAPRKPWSLTPGEDGAAGTSTDDPLPLAGVRILDATAWWAGPMATWVLATLGAEVLHVESVTRPDGMRLVGGAFHDQPQWWERSWFFLCANTNKKDVTLDLSDDRGRARFLELVADVDVVVENYTPRVFEQFGLDWDALRTANPHVLFTRMPAFGLDGPWRDRPGFAQTMESLSGLAWVTGHVDDQPRLQGGPCDPNAGFHAAFAIIAALHGRHRTGRGGLLEVPMVESALNVAAEQVIEYTTSGHLAERAGNRGPFAAPQCLLPVGDDWLALAVPDAATWEPLVGLVPELGGLDRHGDQDAIESRLAAWAAPGPAAEIEARLLDAGIPAAVARDPRLTPDHPHFASRGFYEDVEHPVVGAHPAPGLPFRMTGVDRWVRTPAPTLGQHTLELLRLDDADAAELTEAGVIGTEPRM